VRYALIPYIKQIRFVFTGLNSINRVVLTMDRTLLSVRYELNVCDLYKCQDPKGEGFLRATEWTWQQYRRTVTSFSHISPH
jgi:hypothetical protein